MSQTNGCQTKVNDFKFEQAQILSKYNNNTQLTFTMVTQQINQLPMIDEKLLKQTFHYMRTTRMTWLTDSYYK